MNVTKVSMIGITILFAIFSFNAPGSDNVSCEEKTAQTTGLFCNHGAYEGYTLFSVLRGIGVYLIDNEGNLLWQWQEPDKLNGVKILLTEKGTLIRNLCYETDKCAGNGALIREYDWNNDIIWQYYQPGAHHDIVRLPDGRLLLSVELEDGTESLIKVKPDYKNWNRDWKSIQPGEGGAIEWQWRLRQHVVAAGEDPASHPHLFHEAGYKRLNALDFHPARGEILMSFNMPGEVKTSGQHNSHWIKQSQFGYDYGDNTGVGDILWFNNLQDRVDQIRPPLKDSQSAGGYFLEDGVYGPVDTSWSYDFRGKFDDGRQSSAQRLPNGNTLIAFSNEGVFIEITSDGHIVWKYVSPFCTNGVGSEPKTEPDYIRKWNDPSCEALGFLKSGYYFNLTRYSSSYAGFKGKSFLSPLKQLVPFENGIADD